MKKTFLSIFIVLLIILSIFLIRYSNNISKANNAYTASISEIVDGDLIRLSDGSLVDLVGVYIPKRDEINYRKEIVDNISNLLLNQNVTVETVEQKTIDYPAYDLVKVYLPGSKESINEKLLKEGMAFFDHGFYTEKDYFYRLQKQAEKNEIGIWKDKKQLKVLFVGCISWRLYHFPDCPEIKGLKEKEKIYYYFEPPSIYGYRYSADFCSYCKEKFRQHFSDWGPKE